MTEWNPEKAQPGEIWVGISSDTGNFGVWKIASRGPQWAKAMAIGFVTAQGEWWNNNATTASFGNEYGSGISYLRIDNVTEYVKSLPIEGQTEFQRLGII